MSQFLWNQFNLVPRNERWRGPHHEVDVVRARLSEADRMLVARAYSNWDSINGELTVPGQYAPMLDQRLVLPRIFISDDVVGSSSRETYYALSSKH